MTRKQIDASKEDRLLIGQVIIPTVSAVAVNLMIISLIPKIEVSIAEKADNVKRYIKSKFKK